MPDVVKIEQVQVGQGEQVQAKQDYTPKKPFTIKIKGEEVHFNPADPQHVAEAQKGYMRTDKFVETQTKLAKEREQLRAQIASAGRPQVGLNAGYGGPQGLSPGGAVGEQRTWSGATYPATEQPYVGTPTGGGFPSLEGADDDLVSKRDLARMVQAVQQGTQQQVGALIDQIRRQQAESAADAVIDRFERQAQKAVGPMAGFNRALVEEAVALMDDGQRDAYMRLPKDMAYKLIWVEHLAGLAEPAAPAPGADTQASESTPPYSEGARRPGADLQQTPDLSGPLTSDKVTALGAMVRTQGLKPKVS